MNLTELWWKRVDTLAYALRLIHEAGWTGKAAFVRKDGARLGSLGEVLALDPMSCLYGLPGAVYRAVHHVAGDDDWLEEELYRWLSHEIGDKLGERLGFEPFPRSLFLVRMLEFNSRLKGAEEVTALLGDSLCYAQEQAAKHGIRSEG